MPRRRKKPIMVPKCSILGCSNPAITVIEIHGDGRVWYGCDSDHTRSLIWDIEEIEPGHRGITTRGVNAWKNLMNDLKCS